MEKKLEMRTTKESIKDWESTIPERGDNITFTHCDSGSIFMASTPSIIFKPSTPF